MRKTGKEATNRDIETYNFSHTYDRLCFFPMNYPAESQHHWSYEDKLSKRHTIDVLL
jgi:hypothetical protein